MMDLVETASFSLRPSRVAYGLLLATTAGYAKRNPTLFVGRFVSNLDQ